MTESMQKWVCFFVKCKYRINLKEVMKIIQELLITWRQNIRVSIDNRRNNNMEYHSCFVELNREARQILVE